MSWLLSTQQGPACPVRQRRALEPWSKLLQSPEDVSPQEVSKCLEPSVAELEDSPNQASPVPLKPQRRCADLEDPPASGVEAKRQLASVVLVRSPQEPLGVSDDPGCPVRPFSASENIRWEVRPSFAMHAAGGCHIIEKNLWQRACYTILQPSHHLDHMHWRPIDSRFGLWNLDSPFDLTILKHCGDEDRAIEAGSGKGIAIEAANCCSHLRRLTLNSMRQMWGEEGRLAPGKPRIAEDAAISPQLAGMHSQHCCYTNLCLQTMILMVTCDTVLLAFVG